MYTDTFISACIFAYMYAQMYVCVFVYVGSVCVGSCVCMFVCYRIEKEAREERREKGRKSVCCSVVQCVAACCIVLQCVAVSCIVLKEGSQVRKMLHFVAMSSQHTEQSELIATKKHRALLTSFVLSLPVLQFVAMSSLCCSVLYCIQTETQERAGQYRRRTRTSI